MVRQVLQSGRIIGFAAALLSIFLWAVLLFFNPYSGRGITRGTWALGVAMSLLALVVAWAALKIRPGLMFVAFIASFYPLGLYMLATPGVFRWLGISSLLYLVAGICTQMGQKDSDSDES